MILAEFHNLNLKFLVPNSHSYILQPIKYYVSSKNRLLNSAHPLEINVK